MRIPRLRRRAPKSTLSLTEQAEAMRLEADAAFAQLDIEKSRIRAKYLPMRKEADRILMPVGDPKNMHFIGAEEGTGSLLDPVSKAIGSPDESKAGTEEA